MTLKIKQKEIEELSERFLTLHAQEKALKKELDSIKILIKELAGDDDVSTKYITIKHYSSESIDYKGMVIDSKAKIPDSYKKTSTTVKITVNK